VTLVSADKLGNTLQFIIWDLHRSARTHSTAIRVAQLLIMLLVSHCSLHLQVHALNEGATH
jgi:hypothetical protein